MKKYLFVMSVIVSFAVFVGCDNSEITRNSNDEQNVEEILQEDKTLENYCFDGVFVKEFEDGRICVWLEENSIDALSGFSLCYVAFQKSDLPIREYKEGDYISFKIKKHGEAYEDYKEGYHQQWGIQVRYNCIVEPCL